MLPNGVEVRVEKKTEWLNIPERRREEMGISKVVELRKAGCLDKLLNGGKYNQNLINRVKYIMKPGFNQVPILELPCGQSANPKCYFFFPTAPDFLDTLLLS